RGAFCALRFPPDPEEVRSVCRRALLLRERERERARLLIDLEAMRNMVQDTFTNVLDGVLVLDPGDTIMFANAEGARILLQERSKLIGTKLDPKFSWSLYNMLKKARESPVHLVEEDVELMSSEKRLMMFVRCSTIHDHADQVVGTLLVIRAADKKYG